MSKTGAGCDCVERHPGPQSGRPLKIGIDFGTSYSAAAAFVDGQVVPILFDGEKQFRTAIFFPDRIPDPEDFPQTPATEAWIQRELAALQRRQREDAQARERRRAEYRQRAAEARAEAKRNGTLDVRAAEIDAALKENLAMVGDTVMRSDDDLRLDARRLVRRLWLEQEIARPRRTVADPKDTLFGEAAIDAYLSQHRGNLVQSPKSMLGQRMDANVRTRVFTILCHTLEHIRLTATRQLGMPVRHATIGRPVQFRSSMGEAGGEQAQNLVAEAAAKAGFDTVDFLEEPRAAAFRFHSEMPEAQRAMIIDIGGGTSDIAWGSIGGDAVAPLIAGSHGEGFGGTDIDVTLSLGAFMPVFGRGQPGVPAILYSQAARVSDLPDQAAFLKASLPVLAEPYRARLVALQQTFGGTTLLNREVELAKIALNTQDNYRADLADIDPGLSIVAGRRHLEDALDTPPLWLDRLHQLLVDSRERAGETPELVFLTGGTSRAPYVHALVREVFPSARIVQGDASFGVVDGLARYAGLACR